MRCRGGMAHKGAVGSTAAATARALLWAPHPLSVGGRSSSSSRSSAAATGRTGEEMGEGGSVWRRSYLLLASIYPCAAPAAGRLALCASAVEQIQQALTASDPDVAATREKFDYIIVGGGTAGCVLANRLSADGSKKVP